MAHAFYLSAIGINLAFSFLVLLRRKDAKAAAWLTAFLCYSAVEYPAAWMAARKIHTIDWYNFTYPLIYAAIALLFAFEFNRGSVWRKAAWLSLLLYAAGNYLTVALWLPSATFNLAFFQLSFLLWLLFALLWLGARYSMPGEIPIWRESGFWLSAGVLVSSSMILLLFVMAQLRDPGVIAYMNIFNFLLQLSLLAGLIQIIKNSKHFNYEN